MEYIFSLTYLVPLIFIAGIIDGIAGGGGIIALPAYLITGMPVHSAYACNKLQSGLGTACSGFKYIKENLVDLKVALICVPCAIISSLIGTRIIIRLNIETVRIIIAVCMPLVIIMMALKRFVSGSVQTKVRINIRTVLLCMLCGTIVGTYDAFFGPGCGTTAMIAFSVLLNYDLRIGCGNGKIIIVASNITALVNYIISGHMIYHIAIPCTLANMLGGYVGAVLAVKKGERVIFPTTLIIVGTLIFQVFAAVMV